MSMQHEVTTPQKLLKPDGTIGEPGYARSLIWDYSRKDIKAPGIRIKEWDYYLVLAQDYGVCFTVSDLHYLGLESVSLLNFKENWEQTVSLIKPFTRGKLNLPPSSKKGDVIFEDKRLKLRFINNEGTRRITCHMENFKDGKPFDCDITLEEPPMDSMCIATPWKENPRRFYYNQKINCMRASGKATFDGVDYVFNPETDFGTLDWGRGAWTYNNTWYWGSGNGIVNGKPFGFNLGYGFSDRSSASENMLFYDGVAHKLDEVTFNIPEDANGKRQYMEKWTWTSNDGRLKGEFVPVLDRAALTNALIIVTDQHQVFGKFTGTCTLDDGTVLELKDFLCFAEDVHNKY